MKEETKRRREEKLKKIEYIKKRLDEGAKKQDIAKELGCNPSDISKLISFARKNGLMEPKRTKEDLISEIKRRYEKEPEISKIATSMHYRPGYIYKLIYFARENGLWFTEEEERQIELRKKSILIDQIKRDYYHKTIKQIADSLKLHPHTIEKLIKFAIENGLWFSEEENRWKDESVKLYCKLKRKAKKEDKSERDGGENVSTTARSEFLNILIKKFKSGETIPQEDIEIIINAFSLHTEMISIAGLKLLIMNSYRLGEENGLKTMSRELSILLRGTLWEKNLDELINAYIQFLQLQTINKLKKEGLSNNQIGRTLGYSSAEVSELLEGERELRTSFGSSR